MVEFEVASMTDPIRRWPKHCRQNDPLPMSAEHAITKAARSWYASKMKASRLKQEYIQIVREEGCFFFEGRNGGIFCPVFTSRGGNGEWCPTCKKTHPIFLAHLEARKMAKGKLSYLSRIIKQNPE